MGVLEAGGRTIVPSLPRKFKIAVETRRQDNEDEDKFMGTSFEVMSDFVF